jgi:hypothetical protein
MNAVEQVLSVEMNELLDRLASSVPGGCLRAISAAQPALRKRLDEMEDQLTDARALLLDGYGRWRRALEDLENLWALGAYRADAMSGVEPGARQRPSAAEESVEPARAIAA